MRILAVLVVAVFLAGCSDERVTSLHVQWATDQCAANGGLDYIEDGEVGRDLNVASCRADDPQCVDHFIYRGRVVCQNGAVFNMEYKQ